MRLHVTLREVSIVRTLVLVSLLCGMTAASAEIYRWTDTNGQQIYGDEPPENVRAVESVELPVLTVAERFKTNPKPNEAPATSSSVPVVQEASQSFVAVKSPTKTESEPAAATGYTNFSILVPSIDEVVRSNSGGLNIKLDIKPALKKGHGIVVYVDGRQVGETTTDSIEIDIEQGEHNVFAVLHDAQDSILGNTEAVNFTVVRASAASSSKDRSAKSNNGSTLSNSSL